jgi:hypothetical protein
MSGPSFLGFATTLIGAEHGPCLFIDYLNMEIIYSRAVSLTAGKQKTKTNI